MSVKTKRTYKNIYRIFHTKSNSYIITGYRGRSVWLIRAAAVRAAKELLGYSQYTADTLELHTFPVQEHTTESLTLL